ncbi:hypothetical protein BH18ACT4_BH18ACT4_03770 [soil metagenome]
MGAGDRAWAVVVLGRGDMEVVVGRVAGSRPDLAAVDALARLQLEARRLGCSIRLVDPSEELCELLTLAGLAEVVGWGLTVQVGREAEGGEQVGVEEVVEPGDPAA